MFTLSFKSILINLSVFLLEKTQKIQHFEQDLALIYEIFKISLQNDPDLLSIFLHREFQNVPINCKIVLN